jgi:hypothetical protein
VGTARVAPLVAVLALLATFAPAQDSPPAKTYLLDVAKGQLFTDTGSDEKTYSEAEHADLGKCVKVEFKSGDSVGDRTARVKNWKPFAALEFDAVNPSKETLKFTFNVFHKRTTNFATRVVVPFTLKPGKNHIRIGTDEMTNTNGSAPDLTSVSKWYVGVDGKEAPTVYFSGFAFEGGEAPPATAPVGGPAAPLVGYRIQGTVGDLKVDLTITPIPLKTQPVMPTPGAKVGSDPARLARIKAATMPRIDRPILFDTPEADAIVSALEVFPADNPWNLVVSDWPVHPNSKNIIASIGASKPFRYNPDMGYVLVPPNQKKIDLKVIAYPGESDKGPFPIPDNMPIEGWPVAYKKDGKQLTLEEVQRMKAEGDRHSLVVDPTNRMLYEFFTTRRTDGGWEAGCTAIFDLKSNKLRPDGWTSADAAGLPIFPSVVRYDELKRGIVEHAMRVTVVKSRRAYVYPATHFASSRTDENLPRMGERIRLRQDFDISGFAPEVQAILKGLKKYGMFVADNGIDWAISVTPDSRIPNMNEEFRKVKGSDFEVITPPQGYTPAE